MQETIFNSWGILFLFWSLSVYSEEGRWFLLEHDNIQQRAIKELNLLLNLHDIHILRYSEKASLPSLPIDVHICIMFC